ncbi:MAG TPA: sigma-70 family RNA polymerase sigma factor [Thermoanaerobaculia bacterium]|jgi:RNA polymerase sigma factor (sigma-70 family)|nr:sigma-70 family RNA polymerase sigma factor [Thermoanaerobaculia bacterium]
MERLYLEYLPIIERAATRACRRYGLSREDVEDFTQDVRIKIWEDDCAVLRKHEGRSELATYIVVVVNHALQDLINHRWGKWRPSEAARALGDLATRFERLVIRDRRSFREAGETLRMEGFQVSDSQLSDLAARLPPRTPRPVETLTDFAGGGIGAIADSAPGRRHEPAAGESADEGVISQERDCRRRHALDALRTARAALPAEDQLIARSWSEGSSFANVARSLDCDEKAIYKRKDRIFNQLRQALLSAGVSAEDVAELLDNADS